ncbi:type 1 glutamine amidotransferase [Candidatus Roizmanbacteria bacterium]|nr:type 1 glutamine amidotransferase [Candidatus Roizmanbacteria bacterium]
MKKAVIITGPGFEEAEVIYPFYRLIEAGFSVEIATKNKSEVKGKHGLPLTATVDALSLVESDYHLVVIPGGYEAPDRVRQIKAVLVFIREMNKKNKIIAAVCHGPWVLISAGIMKGRKATCYKGCKDDLINAGAVYLEIDVVVDGNIITSPHFKTMAPWMKAIILKFDHSTS